MASPPLQKTSNPTEVRDVFLSHASVDKESYVRPFAEELSAKGISYWLDEAEIRWGDRITKKINEGLCSSRYVVVFLSQSFLGRNWPEIELESALNKENSLGQTIVLPLIIGEPAPILQRYPLLSGKLYLEWRESPAVIVTHLQHLLSVSRAEPFVPNKDTPQPDEPVAADPDHEPLTPDLSVRTELLRTAIALEPDSVKLNSQLGELLLENEEWPAAADAFRRVVGMEPDIGEWHFKLAKALTAMDMLSEAEIALQNANQLQPNELNIQRALAAVLLKQQKWEQAIDLLENLLCLAPKDKEAKRQITSATNHWIEELYDKGCELEKSNPLEAEKYFRKAYFLKPTYRDVAGRLEEVTTRVTLENLSDESERHAYLGRSYLQKHLLEEAEVELQKAIDLKPTVQMYHALLGRVYVQQENFPRAEQCFQRALEIGPQTAVRYFELGCAAYGQEQWRKAEKNFANALQLDPGSLLYEMNLTKARHKQIMRALWHVLKNSFSRGAGVIRQNIIGFVVLTLLLLAIAFGVWRLLHWLL